MPQVMTEEELDRLLSSAGGQGSSTSEDELDSMLQSAGQQQDTSIQFSPSPINAPISSGLSGQVGSRIDLSPNPEFGGQDLRNDPETIQYRLQDAVQGIANRDPAAAGRFVQAQSTPNGLALGGADRVAVDFLSTAAPQSVGLLGRLGKVAGLSGDSIDTLADTSYLNQLSAENPPESRIEGIGRGLAKIGGFAYGLATNPATPLAGPGGTIGANIGSKLGLSGAGLGAARLSGALAAFQAPESALQFAELQSGVRHPDYADQVLDEIGGPGLVGAKFLGNALTAGPNFIGDIPGMAYRSGKAITEGDYIRAGEEAAPLALIGLGKLGRKKGTTNERQVETPQGEGQKQGKRLLTAEPVATTTTESVAPDTPASAAETRTAVEPEGAKPRKNPLEGLTVEKLTSLGFGELDLNEIDARLSANPEIATRTNLFRETNIDSAVELMPNNPIRVNRNLKSELYFSDNPDLAIGQGNNQGVVMEFSPGFKATKQSSKPTAAMSEQIGTGSEFVANVGPEVIRKHLESITVKPGASGIRAEKLKRLMAGLEKSGWIKTSSANGSITLRKPSTAANQPVASASGGQQALTPPSPPVQQPSTAGSSGMGGGGTPLLDPLAKVPVASGYSPSMIDRAAAEGGPAGRILGKLATQTDRLAKRLGGELENDMLDYVKTLRSTPIRGAKQAVGSATEVARTKAYKDLGTPVEDTANSNFGYSRMSILSDRGNTPDTVLKAGQRLPFTDKSAAQIERLAASKFSRIIRKQFRQAQREGTLLFDPKTKSFKNLGGSAYSKYPRISSDFFHWLLKNQSSPEFKSLDSYIKSIPENQGIGLREAIRTMAENRGSGAEKTIGNIEVARVIRKMPTHMKDRSGVWQELMVSDPVEIAQRAVRSTSARIAYNKFFGQRVKGKGSKKVDKLYQLYTEKYGGSGKKFEDLIRALNDRPVGQFERAHLGRPGSKLDRYVMEPVRAGKEVLLSSLLTAAGPLQLPEPVGSTIPFTGYGAVAKGLMDAAKNPRGFRNELRSTGTITTDIGSGRINPQHPLRSVGKGIAHALRRVPSPVPFDPANELNETIGGLAGRAKAESLKAGKGRAVDDRVLRVMGFTPGEIKTILSGRGLATDYIDVQNRLSGTQPSMLSRAEKSYMANTRLAQVIPFQNYLQHTLRLHAKTMASVAEGIKQGNIKGSAELLARYTFGRVMQGKTQLALLALLGGMSVNLDDESKPDKILKDLLATTSGGPITSMTDAMSGNKPIGQAVGETIPYVSLAQRIIDIWSDKGSNAGAPTSEKALNTIKTLVPGMRLTRAFYAATGVTDPKMETAMRAAYQWRSDNLPSGGSANPENLKFNYKLREAVKYLRNGHPDQAAMSIDEALALNPKKTVEDVRGYIDGKKMLSGLDTQKLASLKESVGQDNYEQLVRYDQLIDNLNWSSEKAGVFHTEYYRLKRLEKDGTLSGADKISLARMERVRSKMSKARKAMDKPGNRGRYTKLIDEWFGKYAPAKEKK